MLTRKHFEAVKRMLEENHASGELFRAFADYFEGENPRFDRERFMSKPKANQ